MSRDSAVPERPASPSPDIRPAGDRALLVEVDGLPAAMALHRTLVRSPLAGQIEAVAAATTVLVRFASAPAAEAARTSLRTTSLSTAGETHPRTHTLDVVYDGEDLDSTAALLGLSREAVVEAHAGTEWIAAFGGFAPGFAYCAPADGTSLWDVPRLGDPRTAVPAGSVGLAGAYSGVYPRRSPGGWRLIGRTAAPLWATDRTPPALLAPGDLVRYRSVRDSARTAEPWADRSGPAGQDPPAVGSTSTPESAESSAADAASASPGGVSADDATHGAQTRVVLQVEDPGMLALIEDGGRPGWSDVGVSPSGFADRASAQAANGAVGNEPGAALLEVVGEARLRCRADVVIAIAGAAGGDAVAPRLLRAGDRLDVTPAPGAARTYVAVRGGLVQTAEVGSASADVLSGLGPAPVGAGAELAVPRLAPVRSVGHAVPNPARVARSRATVEGSVALRVVPGPRADWFASEELVRFLATAWVVGPQSNRVGIRLEAPDGSVPLSRVRTGELPSEGTVTGTVQVPAHGLPVVFGRDRPVTGGYPAIATVVEDDLDLLGQLVPGDRVRFRDARG